MSSAQGTVVHWFRKGLRLHDNPALLAAIEEINGLHFELRPIFILDPDIIKFLSVGENRWRFLSQSLEDLDKNLQCLGSKLYVLRGNPKHVFQKLFKDWNVKKLTFEMDTEPYARERDAYVEKLAKDAGVPVVQKVSHTLFNPEYLISVNSSHPPMTYQRMVSLIEEVGPPAKPAAAPTSLPQACKAKSFEHTFGSMTVPDLSELGVDAYKLNACLHPGGETVALSRLDQQMQRKSWICKFEKPQTAPNSLSPSTTVLSPYLKFGCLSVRLFYHKLKETIKGCAHTKPPVSLIGQLIWREFFYTVASVTPNFDKMVGNPICYQIPWSKNDKHLQAWATGQTGYPFIDAIMRQLRQEGWVHHLARHAVACFLTRGDLWISWEEGLKVFEEFLLDADWSLNAGNWMWLSASAFFHQYFRVYSPIAFGKKTDKSGTYIKKYVSELAAYPSEYIYEPWRAPLSVQRAANCVIGEQYPFPIVDHDVVCARNKNLMAEAYKKHKENKDQKHFKPQESPQEHSDIKKTKVNEKQKRKTR